MNEKDDARMSYVTSPTSAGHHPLIPLSYHPASSLRDWWTLTKPGVMSLVVFTGFTGLLLAPGALHPFLQLLTILCIALGSAGGAAINMWYDRDIDAVMQRTKTRPVPAGRIAPGDALAFGIFLSVLSVSLLGLAVNLLAAGILAFAIFFYAVIYTHFLKRHTPQNIVIGGAAGAFPPVIGWVAASGQLSLEPVLLFMLIFLWTPPHFWALALYRSGDYAKVGVPMLPVTHGADATKRQMLAYTLALVACSLSLQPLGFASLIYTVAAALLGAEFLRHALRVQRGDSPKQAMGMFGYSILYLFLLYGALLADHFLAIF